MDSRFIDTIAGRAVPLRGHDIDTDRIIPARFLKSVSFDGLETHAFEDDRKQLEERGQVHSFWNPRYRGARILIVNGNFGCGSSREHAPQALQRWGIRAIIGESFSEIFFGNSVALGMPCFTVSAQDAETLQTAVEADPKAELTLSVSAQTVALDGKKYDALIPAGAREAFTAGTWDATGLLLDDFDQVSKIANSLPYVSGF
ncbi:MAG TPA: 3-isopropylmalate dehydratase small subunit [Vicinamibacterales bacterium]|nr:3-isopropylmalate dehydratase small subunit [Vicinamibacterales bacterium]